jgi:hypothetical protein
MLLTIARPRGPSGGPRPPMVGVFRELFEAAPAIRTSEAAASTPKDRPSHKIARPERAVKSATKV